MAGTGLARTAPAVVREAGRRVLEESLALLKG